MNRSNSEFVIVSKPLFSHRCLILRTINSEFVIVVEPLFSYILLILLIFSYIYILMSAVLSIVLPFPIQEGSGRLVVHSPKHHDHHITPSFLDLRERFYRICLIPYNPTEDEYINFWRVLFFAIFILGIAVGCIILIAMFFPSKKEDDDIY